MNYYEIELSRMTKRLLNKSAAVEWRLSDLRKVWFVGWYPKRVVQAAVEMFAAAHSLTTKFEDFGRKVTFRIAEMD